MEDHFEVTEFLRKLDKNDLIRLGGALGLSYSKLKEMERLREDMVAAWLNEEDFVSEKSGEPSWKSLKEALKKIGQTGLADNIRGTIGILIIVVHNYATLRIVSSPIRSHTYECV